MTVAGKHWEEFGIKQNGRNLYCCSLAGKNTSKWNWNARRKSRYERIVKLNYVYFFSIKFRRLPIMCCIWNENGLFLMCEWVKNYKCNNFRNNILWKVLWRYPDRESYGVSSRLSVGKYWVKITSFYSLVEDPKVLVDIFHINYD